MKQSKIALAKRTIGTLALEDGRCFQGISVGFEDNDKNMAAGEVVFNIAMTGYQEIITDPASAGQIIAMTTPQIGNTGVNPDDNEFLFNNSGKPAVRGLLMRELSTRVSNWRAAESLPEFLKRNQIIALSEIDTRSLTQHLRSHGTKRGIIAAGDWNTSELVQKAKEASRIEDMDFVESLGVSEPVEWPETAGTKRIIIVDLGVTRSMVHSLASLGVKLTIVPANSSAESIMQMQPACVVLSGGPGNPARLDDVVCEIKELIGKVPLVGIALGHQLLGRAFGAETYKLPYGHRGTQPVLDKQTGKVVLSAQNHHFCLVSETLPPEMIVTHTNLNDGTVEGFRHRDLPVITLQFWPGGQSVRSILEAAGALMRV